MRRIFTPVRTKRTFEEVSSQIRQLILEGTLLPGDKLPPEGELSEQFKVGRQTLREALRILELSGFISVQKGAGGGSTVKDNILGRTSNLLLDALQMKSITVKEFTDARLLIEKGILKDAISNADKKDIIDLQRNLSESKEVIAQKNHPTDLNFEFHSLLARASKNGVYILFDRTINTILSDMRSHRPPNFRIDKAAVIAHEHILEALIKKEHVRAMDLLEKHILTVGKFYETSNFYSMISDG